MYVRDDIAVTRLAGYPREHNLEMRQILASFWSHDIDMDVTLGLKEEILK